MRFSNISVVVPAYNAASTISRTLESVAALPGAEAIVVDDGSSDATASIARANGARLISQANQGPARARANGAMQSERDFVVFLDSDDELVPAGVAASLAALEGDPSLGAVGGRVIGIHGKSETLLPRHHESYDARSMITVGFGPWPPGAAVIRRSALRSAASLAIAPLEPTFAEDFEMFLRIALTSRIVAHDVISLRYALHSGRATESAGQETRDKEALRAYYAPFVGGVRLPSKRQVEAFVQARRAKTALTQGRYGRATAHAIASVVLSPIEVSKKVAKHLPMARRS